jgi:archaellum component FlaF (FlaF/FlaG flagellin family)
VSDDRGSASVEAAICLIGLLLFFALLHGYGALEPTRMEVDAAARSAARQISQAADPVAAEGAAKAAALASLPIGTRTCRTADIDVQIDAARVTVQVACHVDLSAAAVLPVPGEVVIRESASEVFDEHVERV